MDCAQTLTFIECYADGELDALTSATVEKHVQNCSACQHALHRLDSLRSLIKEAAPYRAAPDRLSQRIRAQMNAAAPKPAALSWWKWLRPAALVAATAVVTWIAASQFAHPPAKALLAEEVISSHARATVTGHIADVASSERHTVKPWLSSKLNFSPPVTDLASAGFPLVGGRLDYVDSRTVAVLIYRRRQHVIDLFIWPGNEARPAGTRQVLSKHGYQVLNWTANGMSFWAVSDLNAPELKIFSEQFSNPK